MKVNAGKSAVDTDQGPIQDAANRKNLQLLLLLRCIAIVGQVAVIAVAHFGIGIDLPIREMGAVILFLVALNAASFLWYRKARLVRNVEILLQLLLDVISLTAQLYLSGGATNPFIFLFLLQVIIGAVLLQGWAAWTIFAVTSACYLGLIFAYKELALALHAHGSSLAYPFDIHVQGMFICFVLASGLIVMFVSQINKNLQDRDARLAELRQQAAEGEQFVRTGLIATGAAHELGTPLATLSVILNDWEKVRSICEDSEMSSELAEMRSAVVRCKEVISRILLSFGQARGEGAERTSINCFLNGIAEHWHSVRRPKRFEYLNRFEDDVDIVSDVVFRQIIFNLLDNAFEASPQWLRMEAVRVGEALTVNVSDSGPGFPPGILENFGKPYQSTNSAPGRGLGLFLVVSVVRKLGGSVVARNRDGGGAEVELNLPIQALSFRGAAALD